MGEAPMVTGTVGDAEWVTSESKIGHIQIGDSICT